MYSSTDFLLHSLLSTYLVHTYEIAKCPSTTNVNLQRHLKVVVSQTPQAGLIAVAEFSMHADAEVLPGSVLHPGDLAEARWHAKGVKV